ncbi:hypothetical protein ACLOJK_004248 [Asimina triloba]
MQLLSEGEIGEAQGPNIPIVGNQNWRLMLLNGQVAKVVDKRLDSKGKPLTVGC